VEEAEIVAPTGSSLSLLHLVLIYPHATASGGPKHHGAAAEGIGGGGRQQV